MFVKYIVPCPLIIYELGLLGSILISYSILVFLVYIISAFPPFLSSSIGTPELLSYGFIDIFIFYEIIIM